MDFEVEGVKIPEKGAVIVKNDFATHPVIVGMNVINACWDAVFKHNRSVSFQQRWKSHQTWKGVFAACQRVATKEAEDGFLGYVRPTSRKAVQVPPKSEILVWCWACRS